ncbi:MAG: hypothetical protein HXY40_02445 [Chloroflexi bacterium]|nr:hypothetical protein [Chloroflexota bacterium]
MNPRDNSVFFDFAVINTALILSIVVQTALLGITALSAVLVAVALLLDVLFIVMAAKRSSQQ